MMPRIPEFPVEKPVPSTVPDIRGLHFKRMSQNFFPFITVSHQKADGLLNPFQTRLHVPSPVQTNVNYMLFLETSSWTLIQRPF